jgi:CRISPR-associated protein Csx10
VIRIDVTAQQVIHLGVRPDAGWLTDTHRFVPGSVLRGALAAAWLARNRPPRPDTRNDAEFQRIFEGAVRFGPLYPADDALRPLSIFGCKYPVGRACRDYAHDAAFDDPAPETCPRCGISPTEASKGDIIGAAVAEHTRVELDDSECAKEGQLFTRRALKAQSRLTGLVDGSPDGDLAWLLDGQLPVRLGGRRSTAGLALLSARAEPPPTSFTGWLSDARRLVVRLLSPGIFVDGLGQPAWLPDTGAIGELLGVEVALDAAFARPTMVTGWHAVSNLPKPRDFAVAAGTVYVLRFDGNLPDHTALSRLWRAGLGLRRAEGNGWISLQRWSPPAAPPRRSRPVPSELDVLVLDIIGHGIASLIKDDLRSSAQDRKVGSASQATHIEAVLGRPRYRDLSPEAAAAFRRSLELPPDDTAALARRLDDWVRSRTSSMGRRTP